MTEPLHIISLGAGVQSSTMALMAAAGEITPMPHCAIFADTQAEPASVYKWLDWLEKQLPFPVHHVTKGSLTEVSLKLRTRRDGTGMWAKSLIPAFVKNPDGSKGIMGRACTADFKVAMIIKRAKGMIPREVFSAWKEKHNPALALWRAYLKDKALAKKESRRLKLPFPTTAWESMQEDALVIQWIGISLDEVSRVKPSRDPWIRHRWPLVYEVRKKRGDCVAWMDGEGHPRAPRSACKYCPYHSDQEWARQRDEEPEEFAESVKFDRDLRAVKTQTDNMGGIPFLHSSLVPLDQVDFRTDEDHGQQVMFGNECEGMCGV